MKRLLFASIGLFFLPISLSAQGGGAGFFQLGGARILGIPSASLLPAGAPTLSENHLCAGGSGYFLFRKWMVGLEGNGGMASERRMDTLGMGRSFGTFQLQGGYALVNNPRLKVFPLLGLGVMQNNLRVRHIPTTPPDLSGLTANYALQEIQFQQTNYVASLTLGLDYVLNRSKENSSGGWMLGLRLQYLAGWPDKNWTMSGNKLSSAPSASPQMLSLSILIGGGAFRN
jgi:hypothetical protein